MHEWLFHSIHIQSRQHAQNCTTMWSVSIDYLIILMAATQANKWLSPAKLWCPNLVGLPSLTLWWPSMAWQWKPMSPHEIPWIPYLLIVNMVNLHFHPFLTVDGTTFQPSRLEEADKTQGVDQLLVTWWQPYRDGGTKNAFNRIYSTSTLWLFNIAMENGPFIDDLPIKTLHL